MIYLHLKYFFIYQIRPSLILKVSHLVSLVKENIDETWILSTSKYPTAGNVLHVYRNTIIIWIDNKTLSTVHVHGHAHH